MSNSAVSLSQGVARVEGTVKGVCQKLPGSGGRGWVGLR